MKRFILFAIIGMSSATCLPGMSYFGRFFIPTIEIPTQDPASLLFTVCRQLELSDWQVQGKWVLGPDTYVIEVYLNDRYIGLVLFISISESMVSTEGSYVSGYGVEPDTLAEYYSLNIEPALREFLEGYTR